MGNIGLVHAARCSGIPTCGKSFLLRVFKRIKTKNVLVQLCIRRLIKLFTNSAARQVGKQDERNMRGRYSAKTV